MQWVPANGWMILLSSRLPPLLLNPSGNSVTQPDLVIHLVGTAAIYLLLRRSTESTLPRLELTIFIPGYGVIHLGLKLALFNIQIDSVASIWPRWSLPLRPRGQHKKLERVRSKPIKIPFPEQQVGLVREFIPKRRFSMPFYIYKTPA